MFDVGKNLLLCGDWFFVVVFLFGLCVCCDLVWFVVGYCGNCCGVVVVYYGGDDVVWW